MNTTLSDGTINVQWPSYGHVGVKESISILLDDCAQHGTSIVAFRLTYARLHFHVSDAKRPRTASNSSDGNSGWSFIGSTSSLITASICAVAGTAALEGLGWVGTSYPSVLQRLQTRWGGPTGRLWDWWNLRFCTVCFLLTLHVRTEPLDATPATLEKKQIGGTCGFDTFSG